MIEWNYKPLSDFLTETERRFKPNAPEIKDFKRLVKIDFSGQIHISEKPSKTDMILVNPGDLVISGINVAKGAIAVYEGTEPIVATIHYSSYIFEETKIDINFLKRFLKSPIFISDLQDQVKGGIKTEIKAKHLLRLKVYIPELKEQKKVNQYFDALENNIFDLSDEIEKQSLYLSQLRQAILQEAIEGKLTENWRKKNPVCKGNPDYNAKALLKKIKTEKVKLLADKKIKKQKPLAPINNEEMPFELPNGWIWTRLGDVLKNPPKNGYSPKAVRYKTNVKTLKLGAITRGFFNPTEFKYIDEEISEDSQFWLNKNDILIQRSNSIDYVGVSAIYTYKNHEFIYPDLMMKLEIMDPLSIIYLHKALSAPFNRNYYRKNAKGAQKSMPKINQCVVNNSLIPLPPLIEQQAIVERVEKLLSVVDKMEKQVIDHKEQAEQFKQSVLREAFEGKKIF